jgi:hypothetical protein
MGRAVDQADAILDRDDSNTDRFADCMCLGNVRRQSSGARECQPNEADKALGAAHRDPAPNIGPALAVIGRGWLRRSMVKPFQRFGEGGSAALGRVR